MAPGRPKLLTAMLFAMSAPMAHGQTVDHVASDRDLTSDHENTHKLHKNVISIFCGCDPCRAPEKRAGAWCWLRAVAERVIWKRTMKSRPIFSYELWKLDVCPVQLRSQA